MFLHLIFLVVLPFHFALCDDALAQLLLRVACYRHPSNMRVTKTDVTPCDSDGDCDPEFRFCLSSRPLTAHNCELERLDPFQFEDSSLLGECAEPPPAKNFPPVIKMNVKSMASQLYLTVDLADVDISFMATRTFEIDRLRFDLFPGLTAIPDHQTPSDSNYSLLNISARSFHGSQQPQLSLLGLLQCAPNRYGARCESFCEPTIHYTCNARGGRVCKPGWRGDQCDLKDACVSRPCKSWATCKPVDVSSFECECDGQTGQQCVVGTDPCLNHRCLNGASCVGIDTRPVCYCPGGWKGKFCNLRDPCFPNPCRPNGRCQIKTINNGTEMKASCKCNRGYHGPFCDRAITTISQLENKTVKMPTPISQSTEESFMEESTSVVIMFSVLSGLLLIGIICIVLMCVLRRRKERKNKEIYRLSKTPMIEHQCTTSNHHPPHRDPGNIYDEPGRIYSMGETSDDEREESDPYMHRGDVLLVPHEPRSLGPPVLPQRQFSNSSNHSSPPPPKPVRFVRV